MKKYLSFILLCIGVIIVLSGTFFYITTKNTKKKTEKIAKTLSIQEQTQEIEQNLILLEPYIGGYPPKFESEEHETQTIELYAKTAIEAKDFLEEHKESLSDEELVSYYFLLGQLHRFGHNLDHPQSWQMSELYYKSGLEIDPNSFDNKGGLATLYVNTGIEFAPDAEEIMLSAFTTDLSEEEIVQAYSLLFFANYYQGNISEAADYIEKGLELDPENPQLLSLQKTVTTVMERNN